MKKILITFLCTLMLISTACVNVFAEIGDYEIRFYGNGGTATNATEVDGDGDHYYIQRADQGDTSSLLENQFSKEGYTFVGWSTSANSNQVNVSKNAKVKNVIALEGATDNNNVTKLYAVWSRTLTLAYKNIDTTGSYQDRNRGENNKVIVSTDFDNMTAGITIYDATQDTSATLINEFEGWYYKETSTSSFTCLSNNTISKNLFETLTANGNATLTLYALWTYDVNYVDELVGTTFTKTYERDTENTDYTPIGIKDTKQYPVTSNVGTISSDEDGHLIIFSNSDNNYRKNGSYYHFSYWDTNPIVGSTNGTKYYYNNSVSQGNNVGSGDTYTLYAKYEKFEKVTYENMNKAYSNSDNCDYVLPSDLNVTLKNATGITGYSFKSWHSDKNLNNAITALTRVPETVYAKWAYKVEYIDDTYSISNDYYDRDTTNGKQNSYKDGKEYIFNDLDATQYLQATSNLTKTGYTLSSWNTQADGKGVKYNINGSTVIQSGDLYANGTVNINSNGYHEIFAQWTPKTYTITLDRNGGTTGATSLTATYDEVVTLSENPTRPGYTFDGYYYNNTLVIDPTSKTLNASIDEYTAASGNKYVWAGLNNNLTLTAHWTPITYTVVFDSNKPCTHTDHKMQIKVDNIYSDLTSNHSFTATFDTKYNLESNYLYKIDGYTFKGWSTTATVGNPSSYTGLTSATNYDNNNDTNTTGATITYYAIWAPVTSTVKLHKGNTYIGQVTATYDEAMPNCGNLPTEDYMYFDGYYDASTSGKQYYYSNGSSANIWDKTVSEVNLYAHWGNNEYTVIYDTNIPANASSATKPEVNQTKTYWGTDVSNGVTLVDKDTATGSGTNDFNYNLTGWTFKGWTKDKNTNSLINSLEASRFSKTSGDTITVYSNWEANKVTYKFNVNVPSGCTSSNAASMNDFVIDYDTTGTTTLPSNLFSLEGYSFLGWATSATGPVEFTNTQDVKNYYSETKTVDLYAVWAAGESTIEFKESDPNDATVNTSNFVIKETKNTKYDVVSSAPVVSKNGYTFNGWYTASTNGTRVFGTDGRLLVVSGYSKNSGSTTVWTKNNSTTLYAQYTPIEYTVSYELDGGTNAASNPSNYKIEDSAYTFGNPTKLGYSFAGWTENGEIVTGIAANSYGNKTIKANWTKDTYNITYVLNGGVNNTANPSTYDVHKTLTFEDPTKTGYTFGGWYSDSSYTTSKSGIAAGETGDITIYAKWIEKETTYNFVSNEPSSTTGTVSGSMSSQTVKYDATTGTNLTSNAFTLTGYTFNGWNTAADGSGTSYADGQDVKNMNYDAGSVNLYAQWTPITYTITYDINEPLKAKNNSNSVVTPNETKVTQTFTYDSAQNLYGDVFTLRGWKLSGWNTAADGNGTPYTNTNNVNNLVTTNNGNLKLYAQWTQNEATITFNANKPALASKDLKNGTDVVNTDSSKFVTQTFKFDESAKASYTLNSNSYSLEGWTFKGWATSEDGLVVYADNYNFYDEFDGSSNVTLYAVWEANVLTVEYNSNVPANATSSVTGTMANQDVTYDALSNTILRTNTYKLTGYRFKGWNTVQYPNTTNQGKHYADGASIRNVYNKTENVTLYAQWEPYQYTVVYDANTPEKANTNENQIVTTDYSKTTQAFVYDETKALNGEIYKLKGWTFLGWNTNKDASYALYTSSGSVTNLNTVIQNNETVAMDSYTVTLYAIWQPNTLTITFDPNKPAKASNDVKNGNVVASTTTQTISYDYNAKGDDYFKLTANPYTLTGWKFTGWKDETNNKIFTDLQNIYGVYSDANQSVTLKAQWVQNTYTVHYVMGNKPAQASNDIQNVLNATVDRVYTYDESYDMPNKPDGLNNTSDEVYTLKGWTVDYWCKNTTTKFAVGNEISNLATGVAEDNEVTLYASWLPNTYTVKFHNGQINANDPYQEFTYDITQATGLRQNTFVNSDPNKTFAGWSTDTTNVVKYADGQSVKNICDVKNGVVDLYATWADYKRVDYKFNSTSTNESGEISKYTNFVSESETTSNNPYNIVNNNPAIVLNNATDAVKQLSANYYDIYRLGYVFKGFYKESTFEHSIINLKEVEGANGYTVYEKWEPNVYTINFNTNGGSTINDVTYTYDQKLKVVNPTKAGYTFTGWYLDQNCTTIGKNVGNTTDTFVANLLTGATNMTDVLKSNYVTVVNPSADGGTNKSVTLYAGWVANKYQFTYKANEPQGINIGTYSAEGMPSVDTFKTYDASATLASAPTLNGYTFAGWNTKADGTGTSYSAGATIADLEYVENDYLTVKDANKSTATNNAYKINLYAQWTAKTFTVEFDGNNPSMENHDNLTVTNVNEDVTKTFDKFSDIDLSTIKEPYRQGYTFKGWALTNTATTPISFVENKINDTQLERNLYSDQAVTLYAVWEANSGFKVTFDTNDDWTDKETRVQGTIADLEGKVYDQTFVLPTSGYTMTGYTFMGWSTSKGATTATFAKRGSLTSTEFTNKNVYIWDLDNTSDIADTTTLYAVWQANEYTVEFAKGADNVIGSIASFTATYDENHKLPAATDFSREGYVFDYWKTTNEKSEILTFDDQAFIKNLRTVNGATVTLTAVWKKANYSLSFVPNDNDSAIKVINPNAMADVGATYAEGVTVTNAYVRPGYEFVGWTATDPQGKTLNFAKGERIVIDTATPGMPITLKAVWEALGTTVIQDTALTAGTEVWVDGQKAVVASDGTIPNSKDAKVITTYTYNTNGNYPTGMEVYTTVATGDGNSKLVKVSGLTNLLTYGGTSIRLTGTKGIRIMTEMSKENKLALTGSTGINGYIAVEYGTVMAWNSNLGGKEPTLGFAEIGKAAKGYAYNRAAGYDKVFQWSDATGKEVTQANATKAVYTNVLTGNWSKAQCEQEFAMRPYVILRPVDAVDTSQDIVVYGGTVVRSIQSVANQAIQLKYTYQGVNYWYYATNGSEYNYFVNSLGGTARSSAEASRPLN